MRSDHGRRPSAEDEARDAASIDARLRAAKKARARRQVTDPARARLRAAGGSIRVACAFGDPFCPCQDGDACHYVDLPGSPAMEPPG